MSNERSQEDRDRWLAEQLEPGAAEYSHAFEASKAASLRRLADAFERIAAALERPKP